MSIPLPPTGNGEEARLGRDDGPIAVGADADLLRDHDILRVQAPNPGPMTLSGTNTWVVGRRPAWVVDPGPAIGAHLERLTEAIDSRGGLGGVALTHDHSDHSDALPALLAKYPAPVAGGA